MRGFTFKSLCKIALIAAEILFGAVADRLSVTMTKRLKRKAGRTINSCTVFALQIILIDFLSDFRRFNFNLYDPENPLILKNPDLKFSRLACLWQCLLYKLANMFV